MQRAKKGKKERMEWNGQHPRAVKQYQKLQYAYNQNVTEDRREQKKYLPK